jgi:hypothetical protein
MSTPSISRRWCSSSTPLVLPTRSCRSGA